MRSNHNKSIIRTTLFNVTLSVFISVITLMGFFGQAFWEKESVKLDYKLLNTALGMKLEVDNHLNAMPVFNDGEDITSKVRNIQRLQTRIEPLLQKKGSYSVAYYDIEHDWTVSSEEREFKEKDVLADLNFTHDAEILTINSVRLASVPIIQEGALKGYVWAYDAYPKFEYTSYLEISIFLIMMFAFLCIIILLIQNT